jgi:thiamine-monophosphate kinase
MLARQPQELRRRFALAGGDDYELCFTASAAQRDAILAAARDCDTAVTRIGIIDTGPGLRLVDKHGERVDLRAASFDHFISP